ncbi:Polyamine oxidase 1 [Pseudocercospora fuligena]|uniref:Amine oxidase n=1 Tax=Pseudocercospora fuligena TaxID=685502 RepID=A0A8H6VH29_9PEZI|nr:Polyamine oxidase 1 [Pseudocercospora fuligena]
MRFTNILLIIITLATACLAVPIAETEHESTCQHVGAVILGAGFAGIGAAKALAEHGVDDILVIERNSYIGGRVKHTKFGSKPDGSSHVVELGANWVHGKQSAEMENPIWTLVKKYNVSHHLSNPSNMREFDEDGEAEYFEDTQELLMDAQEAAEHLAEYIEDNELPDTSLRSALRFGGWDPAGCPEKEAVEFFDVSYSNAAYPERSSLLANYGEILDDLTDDQEFHGGDVFIQDPRGYNYIAEQEMKALLKGNRTRLKLNTEVTRISYSKRDVKIETADNVCITADYAICTFSIGVLQGGDVSFNPELPMQKRFAIDAMDMGIYTKIFFQFEDSFWPDDVEYFLWADPVSKGSFAWQSLNAPGFSPGSNIIFATVIGDTAARIESQTDEETKEQMLEVLRKMFPEADIPEPTAFMYPRWTNMPWAFGSYSSVPVGYSTEMLKALRENVGRLWLAGEALSSYQATVHGAWINGMQCVLAGRKCPGYEFIHNVAKIRGIQPHLNVELIKQIPLVSVMLDPQESMAYDFFRMKTLHQLPESLSWDHIALRVAVREPVIAHIFAALGSMHRGVTTRDGARQRSMADEQYSKALSSMRRYIEFLGHTYSEYEAVVILLGALLCFCYESYRGQDQAAATHLQQGLVVLYDRAREQSREVEPDDRVILLRSTPKTDFDVLLNAFARLDSDLSIAGDDDPFLWAELDEPLPTSFNTLEEANVHLDALCSFYVENLDALSFVAWAWAKQQPQYASLDDDHRNCLEQTAGRFVGLDDRPDLLENIEKLRNHLRKWMSAFAFIALTDINRTEHLLTQIFFFYLWVSVETIRDETEMKADRFDDQFEHITSVVEEYLELRKAEFAADETSSFEDSQWNTPPSFTIGTGLINCIWTIISKCRISSVRKRCLKVMRAINLQGVFDSGYLASFLERSVQLEEERAKMLMDLDQDQEKSDFLSHEIPEEARLLTYMMYPCFHRDRFDFYRENKGEAMCVSRDPSGELRIETVKFSVSRKC